MLGRTVMVNDRDDVVMKSGTRDVLQYMQWACDVVSA